MENIATLEAIVTADISRFEQAMADVQRSGQNSMNFLSGLGDFGKNLTLGLTVPLIGAAGAITKIGMDFDANMRNINSLTQKGEEEFRAFSEEVNAFGSATTYGANKTAEALYNIVSAGIGVENTAKAMEMLAVTTKLAESGRDDLDRTTAAMIALEGTYGKAGYSAERLGDITAQMVQTGVGSMNTYTQNLAKALPASINLGISYEELAGTIAILSQTYGNGSKPMTAIGMLTSNLMKPTTKLAAAYEELGVATGTDLINKFGGLMGALEALKGTMSQTDFQKSFSKTGFEAVLLLTNNLELTNAELDKFYTKIDGSVERAWEQQMMSAAAAFDRAKAALEGVAIVLSTHLLPIVTPILNGIADLGNAFIAADPQMQQAVVVIGAIAAAAGPLIWAFSAIVGSLSPIGLALKGAAVAAVLFSDEFGAVATSVKETADKALAALKPLMDALDVFFAALNPDDGSDYGAGLVDIGENIMTGLDGIKIGDPTMMLDITEPTSLWDLYVKQGWDKKYDWHEFMAKVTEGGWDGGQLNPGDMINVGDPDSVVGEITTVGEKIRGAWQDFVDWANDPDPIKANTFNDVLNDAGVVPTELPFIERLKQAIATAWPGVQQALSDLWTQLTGWFDTTVGSGIQWLAGLFTGTEANGGNTPIYEAVKSLLNGDIYAAIDAIIPGAGDHLKNLVGGDWGKKIGEAFPQIRDGLSNLATQFSSWFENDAVPSFAKSIGYFGGKIGVLIGQAIGAVGNFISGGGAGEAAGGIAQGAADFAGLVGEGFQEALTDSGVGLDANNGQTAIQKWADQLVSGIAGALGIATLAAGAFGAFQNGLWGGISGAMSVPLWIGGKALDLARTVGGMIVDKLGLPTSFSGLAASLGKGIAAAYAAAPLTAIALGAIAVTAVVTAIWLTIPDSVKQQLQDGLHGIIDSAVGEGAGATLSRSIERDMYTVARELARAQGNTAGVEYFQGMIDGINAQNDAWLADINLPSKLNSVMSEAMNMDFDLNGMMGGRDITIDPPDIDWNNPGTLERYRVEVDQMLSDLFADVEYEASFLDPESADKLWDEYYKVLAEMQGRKALIPLYAEWHETGKTPAMQLAEAGLTLADKAGLGAILNIAQAILMPDEVVVDTTGATPTVAGDTPPIEVPVTWTFKPADMMGDGDYKVGNPTGFVGPQLPPGGLPKIEAADIVDPALPTIVAGTYQEANTAVETGIQNIGLTQAAALNNGTMNPDDIKTKFLQPLEQYWVATFGEAGVLATTSKTFSTNFITDMGLMGTALVDFNTAINEELTKSAENLTLKEVDITAAMTVLKDNFMDKLNVLEMNVMAKMPNIASKFDLVTTAVNNLVTALGDLTTAAAGVGNITVPGTPVVDGSHAGGLDRVPYDGYIGELHKDEMVLTAREAKQYRLGETSMVSNKTVSRTDNSTTVVNVNGVQDVDGVMKELKRRGVKIGR